MSKKSVFAVLFTVLALSLISVVVPTAAQGQAAPYDWMQFNFDPQKDGNNTLETIITPKNVARLKLMFKVTLPDEVDSAPVYLSGVNTADGVKDLVFVNTIWGRLIAMDALTGDIVWSKENPATDCIVNNGQGRDTPYPCFTTSGPAIDPNRQFVYNYSPAGFVHKFNVADGTEVTDINWPELITIKPADEKGSSHIAIITAKNGTSYLYMPTASYGFPPPGELGEFQGHLTTVNLSDGSQNVFNSICSDQNAHFNQRGTPPSCEEKEGGIWGRPAIAYDAEKDLIYFAVGNGPFDPSKFYWGDSVIALNPDGEAVDGMPVDTFTPTNFDYLDEYDLEVGSETPLLVTAPAGSKYQNLIVQGSKNSEIWLLNRDNLSGQGQPGQVGGELQDFADKSDQLYIMRNAMATWTNPKDGGVWVYSVNGTNGMIGFQIVVDADGNPSLKKVWSNEYRGTSPIIANNILFYANSKVLRAMNPTNGQQYWENRDIGEVHWQSLIVVNGILYVADKDGNFYAFSIDGKPQNTGATQRPK